MPLICIAFDFMYKYFIGLSFILHYNMFPKLSFYYFFQTTFQGKEKKKKPKCNLVYDGDSFLLKDSQQLHFQDNDLPNRSSRLVLMGESEVLDFFRILFFLNIQINLVKK
jgi:hypothetical protein